MTFADRQARVRDLAELLCEQGLASEQLRELDALLLDDAAAQELYLKYVHLDAALKLEVGGSHRTSPAATTLRPVVTSSGNALSLQQAHNVVAPVSKKRSDWKLPAGLLALACSLLIMGLVWYNGPRESAGIVTYASADAELNGQGVSTLLLSQPLVTGRYSLKSGEIRVALDQGANIRLRAPADFRLLAGNRMDLKRGDLEAFVPASAAGFSVNVPGAAVIDRGTHFAIAVDQGGASGVHVLEGRVDVQPTSGRASRSLANEQAARFDPASNDLAALPFNPALFSAATTTTIVSNRGDGKVLATGKVDPKEWRGRRILRVGIGGQDPMRSGCAMVYFFELPATPGGWLLDAKLSLHYVGPQDSEPQSRGPKLSEMSVDLVSLGTRNQPVIRSEDYHDGRAEDSTVVLVQNDFVTANSRPGVVELSADGQRALMRHLRDDVYTRDGVATGRYLALRLNPSVAMPRGRFEIRGFLFTETEASHPGDLSPKLDLEVASPSK